MKTKLFILAISFYSLNGMAQDNENPEKSSLTVRSGASIPFGAFSETHSSQNSGFATDGYHIAAEYTGYLDNYFGLGLTVGMRRNPVNIEAYRLEKPLGRYFVHTNWRTNYLLANSIFKIPLAPVLSLYLKVSAGASFNTYPDINSNEFEKTQREYLKKSEGFAYGLGSGIKWQGKMIGTSFEVQALKTHTAFEHNYEQEKHYLHSLQYSFGLSYIIK